ncbi:MAG: RdgB/HAM1 family non-canonical purine NTP pyrophosphatase [Ignavibacteria bacterium]|nr:RdgB/HAM1 family non-canonical purine NTP pyrophosphatase [Ignavibacteria bacterium]MBI3766796.1 RdgB/HAM1 family non-canonical purine NTP pyrophosphatase [Ignavibacteriales bacterium]
MAFQSTKTLILATRNPGKVEEITSILSGLHLTVKSLLDYPNLPEVVEDGQTLEENALKKAREIFRATAVPALSDDTGLEVFYLGMKPGVFSARYAGENVSYADNNRKLLAELKNVPINERRAQFRCVAAFIGKGVERTTHGVCPGRLLDEVRGSGGFGYDPLFVPDGYEETFAQLPGNVKNSISHRAMAFGQMETIIAEYFTHF